MSGEDVVGEDRGVHGDRRWRVLSASKSSALALRDGRRGGWFEQGSDKIQVSRLRKSLSGCWNEMRRKRG